MVRNNSGIVTRKATCPECGAIYRWREQAGLKRFRAKIKECPECGNIWR